MRLLPRLLLALLVLSAVGYASEYHPSLPAIGSLDGLGVNIHFTDPQPGELEMIKAAGFKWVRMDFAWAGTEREAGKYDFAAYDRLVTALEKNGLRAVFILDYGNPLYDGGVAPHTDEGRAAFAKWASAAVSHFKGRGFLWELWNEPNIAQFWKPKPDAQHYIALAKAVAAEVRKPESESRKEAFIGPACSTVDLPFLEECMKAGLLEFFDGVSVHPYRQTEPETVVEEYRSVRLLIRKYAPKEKEIPVLSGEWGYSTGWKDFDEERQAKYLARQVLTNIANDVPLSIWYDWRDDGDDPKEPEHHFGIVRAKYRKGEKEVFEPKPAYRAAKILTTQLSGTRFNKDITEMAPEFRGNVIDNPILLFTNKDETRLAIWRGGEGNEIARVAASPGKFSYVSVLVNEKQISIAPDADLMISSSDAVVFLQPERPNPLLQAAAAWKRLPLEVFANAPTKITLTDEFTNPLNKTVPLPGWTNPDDVVRSSVAFHPPGHLSAEEVRRQMAAAEKAGEVMVGSGIPNSRLFEIYISRATLQTRLLRWFQIRMGDRVATFSQHTEARPVNPLRVQLLPPGKDFLPVLVKNESGEAFSAKCTYYVDGDDYIQGCGKGEISFRVGETEKIMHLHPVENSPGWGGNRLMFEGIAAFFPSIGFAVPFPSAQACSVVADGDKSVAVSREFLSAEPPDGPCPSGTASLCLRYAFKAGWGFLRVVPPNGLLERSERSGHDLDGAKSLGMWIWGDGRGMVPRVRFRDNAGTTYQASGEPIRHHGWKFVTIPIAPFLKLPHWGGEGQGDRTIYPVKWDTIFLLDNASREAVEGEVYFSDAALYHGFPGMGE